jgi:hypothetical protein
MSTLVVAAALLLTAIFAAALRANGGGTERSRRSFKPRPPTFSTSSKPVRGWRRPARSSG